MPTVDDYIATVTPAQQAEFRRISNIVQQVVPAVEQGTSYGMPAFMYQGKALISFIAGKKFLSIYPFSGKVVAKLQDKLSNFECTSGSIHFSEEHTLPEALLKDIIMTRLQEIENKTAKPKSGTEFYEKLKSWQKQPSEIEQTIKNQECLY